MCFAHFGVLVVVVAGYAAFRIAPHVFGDFISTGVTDSASGGKLKDFGFPEAGHAGDPVERIRGRYNSGTK